MRTKDAVSALDRCKRSLTLAVPDEVTTALREGGELLAYSLGCVVHYSKGLRLLAEKPPQQKLFE